MSPAAKRIRTTATPARARRPSVLDTRQPARLAQRNGAGSPMERLEVRKTYKLYIGGEFPRTESGRAYEVFDARGRLLANACRATRKDIRDAVRAARRAQQGWAARTAFNRSQILYRIAELMEGRRDQFISEVVAAQGVSRQRATREVDAAIDRWVWYAGWADKFGQITGSVNRSTGATSTSASPSPLVWLGFSRRRTPPCLGWSVASPR
jgi:hypothetical protein